MRTATDFSRLTFLLVAGVVLASVLWALRPVVMLVGFSLMLAYALDPIVGLLGRVPVTRTRHVPRALASAVVVLVIALAGAGALGVGIPRLIVELERFIAGAPGALHSMVAQVRAWADSRALLPALAPLLDRVDAQAGDLLTGLGGTLGRRFGALLGGVGRSLEFALLPVLTFYLLAERTGVETSALRFVPEEARPRVGVITLAVDRALRSYVRGQAIVVLTMGTATGLALMLLHVRLALFLGVLAGIGELVPYIGSSVAAIAITLAGVPQGPEHALSGLAAYVAVNWTIGALVTPRVMGRHLKMHPFVVTVSVLCGAELLGAAGAMLALPTAAVLQSLVAELAPRPEREAHGEAAT